MRAPATAAALAILLPAAALGHGAGWRVAEDRAVVIELHYADGEAMPYAELRVFAPGEATAFLHGRADRRGRAAFVPDRDGDWRIEARDAEGHALRASVPVRDAAPPPAVPARERGFSWLLWFSLALNIFGLATWWQRRRTAGVPSTPRARGA